MNLHRKWPGSNVPGMHDCLFKILDLWRWKMFSWIFALYFCIKTRQTNTVERTQYFHCQRIRKDCLPFKCWNFFRIADFESDVKLVTSLSFSKLALYRHNYQIWSLRLRQEIYPIRIRI